MYGDNLKLTDLLTRKDFLEAGWEITTAKQKSFYVTGAMWFSQHVVSEITKVAHYTPEFDEAVENRGLWRVEALNWNEHFSTRQAIDALSLKKRKPLRFIKAAHTILLCEVVLEEDQKVRGISTAAEELYKNMRIEPAIYYVEGYDTALHRALMREADTFRPKALRACKQRFMNVFEDLARGYTVTYELAKNFHQVVSEFAPNEIGEVVPEIYADSLGASVEEVVYF